jgi:4a-hydroxytetrahydrobiopterin dehydratase
MALSDEQIANQLADLTGWKQEGKSITKTFTCDDFSHAMDFVTHVGDLAEEHDHHPDIDIRYNKVTLTLSTHSDGGVTDKDIKLATEIDGLQ